jgi:2-C-methyl-D-erythritol 4-phosphate cytidylyltransferase
MPRYFALVPAAGSGTRLGGATPKQYLPLAGRTLLYHSVRRLVTHPRIEHVFVVLSPQDSAYAGTDWGDFEDHVTALRCGGSTRAESVLNGLLAARRQVRDEDWMLVHDAARPCLTRGALDRLIRQGSDHEGGALLAIPVADTLKRGGADSTVTGTESRSSLWQAQTPQMFRYQPLVAALQTAKNVVSDEASAVEAMGVRPRLIMGEPRNLKVTYPEDFALAELILRSEDGAAR